MSQKQGKSAVVAIMRSHELIMRSGVVFMMSMVESTLLKLQNLLNRAVQLVASDLLE